MKQKLTELKAELYNSIIIDGNFNILLLIMDTIPIQKINKEIKDQNNIKNKLDLTDIYGIFLSTTAFFSSTHRSFSRINNMIGHRSSLIHSK